MAIYLHCLFAIFLIVTVSVIQGYVPSRLFYILSSVINDQGRATNCGPPGYNFSLWWTPKVINIPRKTTYHLDMVAAEDFEHGNMEFTFSRKNSQEILIKVTKNVTCQQIKPSFPMISCPIKRNDHIFKTFENRHGGGFPPLNDVFNLTGIGRNSKQEVVFCFYAIVKIIS